MSRDTLFKKVNVLMQFCYLCFLHKKQKAKWV